MSSEKKYTAIFLFAILVFTSGCRPSQQSRRNAAKNTPANAATVAAGRSMDSLYMVQNKLLTIIDTMSDVLVQDRARIRDLEIEVAKLKSLLDQQRISGSPAPPQAPPIQQPAQSYTAPAPPPAPPVQKYVPSQPEPQPVQQQSASYPPNDMYSAALTSFNNGQYMDALTSFDELSRSDPSSPYAPNFLYWKGESLYALRQYAESIRTFHDVLNKYPTSSKADDAEFKIGAAYEKLGDKTNARSAYNRLILSFPESEYRARAETRLNKLR